MFVNYRYKFFFYSAFNWCLSAARGSFKHAVQLMLDLFFVVVVIFFWSLVRARLKRFFNSFDFEIVMPWDVFFLFHPLHALENACLQTSTNLNIILIEFHRNPVGSISVFVFFFLLRIGWIDFLSAESYSLSYYRLRDQTSRKNKKKNYCIRVQGLVSTTNASYSTK